MPENYSAQLTAVFILEFGVIFHSIFIGLTLAVAGAEFITLYIVLVFHQTFEGLGLGSRIATIPWPKSKRWTPYILASAYGITTPVAIAIGLGVRTSFAPGSANTLITNGIFDSISAGILIYTGLVELMAHEFLFSTEMRKAPIKLVMSAFALMTAGAGKYSLVSSEMKLTQLQVSWHCLAIGLERSILQPALSVRIGSNHVDIICTSARHLKSTSLREVSPPSDDCSTVVLKTNLEHGSVGTWWSGIPKFVVDLDVVT